MTNDNAISVRDVTKKYRLFATPSERLKEALHPFRKRYHQEFWALNGVSIDVPRGHTVGIIGRNGSGKSTLLQIIASVLQPTSGSIAVRGRVAALLELGAGFNPDFTGRDNAILYGVIQGISRNEMLQRISEIEAFADIGEFFDQPVKIYSSGMFVRLAFAAAIHVDPDILIIDEALAVGDSKFQHKCFLKFAEFKNRGNTIIFATHSLNYVTAHCDRAILLERGRKITYDKPNEVVDRYLGLMFGRGKKEATETVTKSLMSSRDSEKSEAFLRTFIEDVDTSDRCPERTTYNKYESRLGDGGGEVIDHLIEIGGQFDVSTIPIYSEVNFYIKATFHRLVKEPIVGFAIKTVDGITLYGTNTSMLNIRLDAIDPGEVKVFHFRFMASLFPRDYFLDFGIAEIDGTSDSKCVRIIDERRSGIHFTVCSKDYPTFDGFVDLKPVFEQVSLRTLK